MSASEKRTPPNGQAWFRSLSLQQEGNLRRSPFPQARPAWETNLENDLVEEGYTRAKARRLVRLAAS